MSNKNIQAQMQIDVSFIGNTTKLIKDLQSSFDRLNLSSNLTKTLEADLSKGFKDTLNSLKKMSDGLAKPGLSDKQYTVFFNSINQKIGESTKIFATLKKSLNDIYKSDENKKALKDIEEYKKQLEELKKLSSTQKGATTRQETAIQKIKNEAGLDYNISKRNLSEIAKRKNNKQDLTKGQQQWLAANGIDEATLKRVLELLKQINNQKRIIEDANAKAKAISGQSTVSSGISATEKGLALAQTNALTPDIYKGNIKILDEYEQAAINASNANRVLEKDFDTVLPMATAQAEKAAAGMKTLNDVLSQFGIVLSAGTIVRAFKDIATEAFNFYKSLDSALNEIYIVSNLSIEAVNNLKTNFIAMAKDTGMALDDVTRSAVLFYQQGLNTKEVMEMTEVTSQFAKVAGIDATDAADKLTAAVNGYCLAAEDASLVADKFNKVAAASAADINELSTAFSKAAAQANQAGVGMDNYLAYLATMIEVTREAPENIGTSLKTIMARMQQVKEGGTTEEGDTDVNQVETALRSVGIQLRNTEGQLRDLEDVFDELGPKWQSLDRNTQAYLGTVIAGTRQQSRFISLMQNWDRVLDLADQSANSAGQQALMHAKAMESIESKLQQFQVAWQEFISNLTSSDFFKGIIESLTKLVDSVNGGTTPFILLGTSIGLLIKNITKLEGPFGRLLTKIGKGAGNITNLTSKNIKLAASYVKNQNSVKQFTSSIKHSESEIARLSEENRKLIDTQTQTENLLGRTREELLKQDEQYKKNDQQIKSNTKEINNHQNAIIKNKKAINGLVPTLEEERQAYQNIQSGITTLTVGLAALSATLPGVWGSIAGAASGISMTIGAATMGVQLFIETTKKGVEKLSAAEKASVILTIISIGVQAIMGVITAVKALGEAFGNQDKNIAESIENMTDALEKYNNAATTSKAAKNLLKDYEELSKKVYLTAKEQEKLNSIAQQLGDSLDIEVVEDEYGNLSLSIQDVTDKMTALAEKSKQAREELIKVEQEQIEKYDHNGNVKKFYEGYLSANRADIRTAMGDIETGIDTKQLATSATNVNNIMTNLKNAIIDNSAEMADAFGGLGIEWSLTEDVQSMIDSFNNADIDSTQWNSLFQTFDSLQERIDSLSYDDALQVVEGSIAAWGKAAGLSAEQINILKDSIMNSLYSDSNLHKTISKYQDIIDNENSSLRQQTIADYETQASKLEKESTTYGTWGKDEKEAEAEAIRKKIELLEEEEWARQRIATLQKQLDADINISEQRRLNMEMEKQRLIEEYGIATEEEIQKTQQMINILEKFSDSSASVFDKAGLFDEDAKGLLEHLENSGALSNILSSFKIDEKVGTKHLTDELVNIILTTDDPKLKKAAEDKFNEVFENIEIKGTMTWGDLSDTLDSTSSSLRKMNGIMSEFNENGGLSLDTFADLCDILDSIDLTSIFNTDNIDNYINALDTLQLGFDATTGTITANGQAMMTLQEIQEDATRQKLEDTAKSLEADKAELQAQIYGIQAEMKANTMLIQYLQKTGKAKIHINDIAKEGQNSYLITMQQASISTAGLYQDMTSQSATWAAAAITNAVKVGEAIKKAMSGQLGTANLQQYLNGIIEEMDYTSTGSYTQLDIIKDENGMVDVDTAIQTLLDYNTKGEETIKEITSKIKGLEAIQGLLNDMSKKDLSKLGADVDTKEIEKYIGQLKEIYNIRNKIALLEHRESMIEEYMNISSGAPAGKFLVEQLRLNKLLLKDYDNLVTSQKQYVNGYREFIEQSEFKDVFDFDEYGNIKINMEEYNKLNDEAVDGQKSMKEQADDMYDTYVDMYDELKDDVDGYIDRIKIVIEIQEKMIDNYISLEDQAADTVKQIYQDILDTKLEAIDKEIEALNELKDARDRTNKANEDAKELSNLQTDLQRSLMDTSGASDIDFLDTQQAIQDKLEEMAEDKYTQQLDDIIEALEEEKNSLQDNFDEMFKNTEWLHNFLRENVMGDGDTLYELLSNSEDFLSKSPEEQRKIKDEWEEKFTSYIGEFDSKDGLTGLQRQLAKDREDYIDSVDESLKTYIDKKVTEITSAIKQVYNIQNNSSSGSGSGNKNTGGGKTNTQTTPNGGGSQNNTKPTYNVDFYVDGKVVPSMRKTVEAGTSISLPAAPTIEGCKFVGWRNGDYQGMGPHPGPGVKVTVNSDQIWFAMYSVKGRDTEDPSSYIKKTNGNILNKQGGYPNPFNTAGYSTGGFVDFTGPAMLHGSKTKPEAVLNALQTAHFIDFTRTLDRMYSTQQGLNKLSTSINIDNILFTVESMSSVEDGERAFNMFVDKFKEIGYQRGIKIDSFKNRL